MATFFFFVALVNAFAVLGVLICGLYVTSKGGDLAQKWSNKLMQLRVLLQAIAVILIMLTLWLTGGGRPS